MIRTFGKDRNSASTPATLTDLTGELDAAPLLAQLAWRPADPRPTLRAIIATTRLDLDAWLATPPTCCARSASSSPPRSRSAC